MTGRECTPLAEALRAAGEPHDAGPHHSSGWRKALGGWGRSAQAASIAELPSQTAQEAAATLRVTPYLA